MISDANFLQLCASITKGNTIYLGTFTLVPISSWWNLFKRRWNSEDRNVVLEYINLRISKILTDLYTNVSDIDPNEIKLAIVGLRQLQLTYENDEKFNSDITIVINKMEHFLRNISEVDLKDEEPEFNPTLISKTSERKEEGAIIHTLKKIHTWSELHNRSPPQFNSLLDGIKSSSFDTLRAPASLDFS